MMAAGATPTQEYGGFYYDFVETPPERLLCKICKFPSRDPCMTLCCGHAFCKSCLERQKQAKTICYTCPMCREEEPDFKTVPYVALSREIKSLHIYCTNKERGCEWHGELNNITNHLGNSNGCQFEEVQCSNECGKMIQRRHLTSHVETECPRCKVNCQYCHNTGEHQFIEGQHKEECPKLPLPCPNKCEVGCVPREDMEAHRKECPLEMIQCEYYSVGCEVRMARKDKEKHKNKKHQVTILQSSCNKQKQSCTQISGPGDAHENTSKKDLPFDMPVIIKHSPTNSYSPTSSALSTTSNEVNKTDVRDLRSTEVELPTTKHKVTDKQLTLADGSGKPKKLSDELPTTNTEKDLTMHKNLATTQKQLFAISND